RLLQRRAHGAPRAGARRGGRGLLWRGLSPAQQRPCQGVRIPRGRQHRPGNGHCAAGWKPCLAATGPPVGRAPAGRLARAHGLSARPRPVPARPPGGSAGGRGRDPRRTAPVTVRATSDLRNRWAVPRASIPDVGPEEFRRALLTAIGAGGRFVAYFGMPEEAQHVRIYAVVEDELARLAAISTRVLDRFPSLTPDCSSASRFECEIAEQCGVEPAGHPAVKPVRRHPPDHLPSGRAAPAGFDRNAYPFERIESHDVHEVGVGPVHAGIIEPGHFRFRAYGEEVLDLEIMLGYQHRGVERLLETLPPRRGVLVAESIAGDTVIGHAEAYCAAYEALGRARKSPRAQAIRGVALELERLANHLGDLGAMA